MRYVDVLTAAATTRSVESYESTLRLDVRSSRRGACFDTSIELRDRVIAALKSAGLSEAEIQEGGGNVALMYWSSGRSVSHSIIVRNNDMAKLMSAMAGVEQVFASLPRSFFSPVRQSFTFDSPKPVYAPSVSAEDAMSNAMQRARTTADSIAAAHGETIESLISVVEISVASQRNLPGHDEMDSLEDTIMDFCDTTDAPDAGSYPALGDPAARGTRRFRVRFSLKSKNAG